MRLTIIGYWGGYPKANGASAGYLLEQDGFYLAIDFGSGVLSKMQNFLQPEEIDAVILSHYHSDHVADIGVLQHARLIGSYLGKTQECLPIYGHTLDEQEFAKLTYKNISKGMAYQEDQPLTIGPFQVTFLRTKHPATCFAMRFEAGGKTMVYTGDTAFKEELVSFSKNADLLLCECNFYKGQNGSEAGHMTSIDAGRLAEMAGVKQLILTHLPHYGNLSNLLKEASEKYNGYVNLADYGKIIII